MALSWPSVPVGILFRSWLNSTDGRRPPPQNSRNQNAGQIFDRDAILFHRIAFSQGDGITERRVFFAKGFKIDSDAERRADFILAPITAADRSALVVKDKQVRPEK